MSKQEEAGLILKLYELRREDTMRAARNWYFTEFNPQSMADFNKALFGEHSGHLRMVTTYWDMAAALVNNGAISLEMFNDANGEQIGVFSKSNLCSAKSAPLTAHNISSNSRSSSMQRRMAGNGLRKRANE